MLQLLDLGRSDVFAYRASGVLTEQDIRRATDAFDLVVKDRTTVHLYAEIENLKGVEARGLWLDLLYGLRHIGVLRHVGRVAVVTDTVWVRRVAETEALLLPIGQLHTFDLAQREEARAWVRDAPMHDPLTRSEVDAWFGPGDYNVIGARGAWFDERVWHRSVADLPRKPRAPQFGHTIHSTHTLLHAIANRLETVGTVSAYHALRAVLHALRDRLPASEAADLAAQLTTVVRGVFYEGYRPGSLTEKADRERFLEAVAQEITPDSPFSAEDAVRAVGDALAEKVSDGEWRQVLHALPQDIRSLFEEPVPA